MENFTQTVWSGSCTDVDSNHTYSQALVAYSVKVGVTLLTPKEWTSDVTLRAPTENY